MYARALTNITATCVLSLQFECYTRRKGDTTEVSLIVTCRTREIYHILHGYFCLHKYCCFEESVLSVTEIVKGVSWLPNEFFLVYMPKI